MSEYCAKCGTKLRPDAVFCPECGTKIQTDSITIKEDGKGGLIFEVPEGTTVTISDSMPEK